MTIKRAVAVYARISQDRSGEELGVKRQLKDCRAEAARRGWTVAEEYVDDDISAYSRKTRPAYERMLRDVSEGRRDAVIVWHMDRLHRQPIELEHFRLTCEGAGVSDVVTLHGDIDLAKGDGLMMARLLAMMAAKESDDKSRRGARKALEIAEAGRPTMGGPRPFGFLEDRIGHDPAEAPYVRVMFERFLAGESLNSIARWLEAEGVQTTGGKAWRTNTIRSVLTAPRYWGKCVHNGEVVADATWEGIVSPEQGERAVRILADPARKAKRAPRRYLLSGRLRCGLCGGTLYSAPKEGVRRYGCTQGDARGCGRIYITADRLEAFIADAVLMRLDSPDLFADVTGREADAEQVAALGERIAATTARMDELAEMWADGDMSRQEHKAARDRLEARLTNDRRALARLTHRDAIEDYVGRGSELRDAWETLALTQQAAIIKAVIDYATIQPASKRGMKGLDPARVEPQWRL